MSVIIVDDLLIRSRKVMDTRRFVPQLNVVAIEMARPRIDDGKTSLRNSQVPANILQQNKLKLVYDQQNETKK